MMDTFPIELIENILRFSTGNQFCVSGRVSTNWLKAKQNIERTDRTFWRNRCRQEIQSSLIEDLNPYHRPVDLLDGYQCKQLYIKWFRTQNINQLPKEVIKYKEYFGSAFSNFESITTLTVTGNLVITGHRSGKVHLIDVFNDRKPIEIAKHIEAVNDLVAVNLVGEESYELHKIGFDGYPTDYPSFSNHHHIISIGEGSRIIISLVADRSVGKEFQICPITQRHFLKGRVCRDMFAVSTKEAVDISLFRLVLPKSGVVPIRESLKAELITTISCRQVFNSANHWLGLFTFSGYKLNCFCHEFNLIACSDVGLNLSLLQKKDNFKWKWNSINEVLYEYRVKSKDFEDYDCLNIKFMNGFSFGDQIFFLITYNNETVYTTDSKTFHLCQLGHWLQKNDKVMSLSLFGSVLAVGTHDGWVYVHRCPTLKRLQYISHYKPLYKERIFRDPILMIKISDTGMGPVLAAATKQKVHLINWAADQNWNQTWSKTSTETPIKRSTEPLKTFKPLKKTTEPFKTSEQSKTFDMEIIREVITLD